MQVRALLGDDAPLLGESFANLDASLEAVHSVEFGSGVGNLAGLVHDGGHRQVVPQAHLEVVGIVSRRDLHSAGSELGVDVVVRDDRDLTPGERMIESGADEVLVALVLGMDRHCGITEHRLDASGRDDDVRLVVVERAVAQGNQLTLDVLELHLDVGDRGLQHRRPVHETLGAVDQTLVEHALEDGLNGAREALVHRETIATPVDTVTDAPHLAPDGSTRFALPVPNFVDEELAAEIFLCLAVGSELLLDDGLRGDTGVIHAR